MATNYGGRRLSTEEVCREAAEKLGQMHIRSFKDDSIDSNPYGAVPLHNQEQPPPYYGPLGWSAVPANSPASFLVPPPPPPSPGKLAASGYKGQDDPVPSAPPPPPLPPSFYQPTASPACYLQLPMDPAALSQGGSVGPSPVHIPSFQCQAPYSTGELPLLMAPPDPSTHYPPPTRIPANTTPVMIQPPLPPPPPPLPPSVAAAGGNNLENQCNNPGSVNVNMDSAPVVADMNKKHLYPNYLSFTLCMASLCWLCNITTYICIIPAIICSAVSCSASTYNTSKFAGKWALCCNLTALIYGLVSFLVAILPLVIVFSLAAAGYAGLQALEDWLEGGGLDYDYSDDESYNSS